MRVRMLITQVGPGVDRKRGHEYDLKESEAIYLVEKGKAVPVSGRKIEKATAPPPELRRSDEFPKRKKRRKKKRANQQ